MADVYEKLLRSSFDRLPQPVREAYLSPPIISAPVEPAGDGFRLTNAAALDRPATEALIPKLGIKSWRDSGGLGVIYKGVSMRAVLTLLLQSPSEPQKLAAKAWTRTDTPLQVQLAHYVDFSNISEARYLAQSGACRRLSVCLRGSSAKQFDAKQAQLTEFAEEIADHLDKVAWIIELAFDPEGMIRLVEVNPGLGPKDLHALME